MYVQDIGSYFPKEKNRTPLFTQQLTQRHALVERVESVDLQTEINHIMLSLSILHVHIMIASHEQHIYNTNFSKN